MMLVFIPTAIGQPNLGSNELIDDNARILDTEVFNANMQPQLISELFDGKDALIIAVALPGTQNVAEQAIELNKTVDLIGNDVSVVHLVSGMDATTTDVSTLKNNYNMTWDSYVDLNETFTMSTPNGTADSILVLDKTMRVVYSNAPSAPSKRLLMRSRAFEVEAVQV